MTLSRQIEQTSDSSWADLSGRWFFAWRMAAACEDALREISTAQVRQLEPGRANALARVTSLLREELNRWVRTGEALDMIVDHLPKDPS